MWLRQSYDSPKRGQRLYMRNIIVYKKQCQQMYIKFWKLNVKKRSVCMTIINSITQEQYYSIDSAICFIHTILFNIFFLQTECFLRVAHIKHCKRLAEHFTRVYTVIDSGACIMKTFALSWCITLILFCNMHVTCFCLTCWISLFVITSDFCWRLNRSSQSVRRFSDW